LFRNGQPPGPDGGCGSGGGCPLPPGGFGGPMGPGGYGQLQPNGIDNRGPDAARAAATPQSFQTSLPNQWTNYNNTVGYRSNYTYNPYYNYSYGYNGYSYYPR
jgi:hypothetical protein